MEQWKEPEKLLILFVIDSSNFSIQSCCSLRWQGGEGNFRGVKTQLKPLDHCAGTESSSAELQRSAEDSLSRLCSGTEQSESDLSNARSL